LAQPPSKITSGGNGVMKLEDQVVSLELATKLAELNVPQTGALVWSRGIRHGNWRVTLAKYWNWPPRYSAYTVAELGKMLPWNGIPHFIVSRYTDGKYNGFLYLARSVVHFNENSEVNARDHARLSHRKQAYSITSAAK
jgi:hypothetical protein